MAMESVETEVRIIPEGTRCLCRCLDTVQELIVMQLSYRGSHYDLDLSSADMVDSGMKGVYRGQTFPITYPRHIPTQPSHELRYRGAAYRTTATGSTEAILRRSVAAVPTRKLAASSTYLSGQTCRVLTPDLEKMHRLNIQQRLQHRIEVARAKGDQALLHMLEREMQQAS
jgi:hypothetical protein